MGAIVEFELHSSVGPGEEVTVDVFPTSVTEVPEPADALPLATAPS